MSDIPLREYVDRLVNQERELRELQYKDTAKALLVAKETVDNRMQSMNELREQINLERGTYVSRELFDRVEERMRAIENYKSNIDGRLMTMGGIIVFIQIIITIINVFWLKK